MVYKTVIMKVKCAQLAGVVLMPTRSDIASNFLATLCSMGRTYAALIRKLASFLDSVESFPYFWSYSACSIAVLAAATITKLKGFLICSSSSFLSARALSSSSSCTSIWVIKSERSFAFEYTHYIPNLILPPFGLNSYSLSYLT